jgi:hypothetical protein
MNALSFGVSFWAWCATDPDVKRVGQFAADGRASHVLELPPAERRRLNPLTSLALRVGETLVSGRLRSELQDTPLVFGSADGDGDVLMKLLNALRDHQAVSPTQFHNSVHNAPTGYWMIGLSSQAPSTAIAADEDTLEVSLVEAGLQAAIRGGPVLMLMASRSYPPELRRARPDTKDFAIAAWCEPASRPGAWCCTLSASAQTAEADASSLESSIRSYGEAGLACRKWVRHLAGVLTIERVSP